MNPCDCLFRAFNADDVDDNDDMKIETIGFPDFSCNWSRFSLPSDVRLREHATGTDGAYSFTISTARYKQIATPVHDPVSKPLENYSHVEVRELYPGESAFESPPRNRKKKSGKARRLEYRQNLINSLAVELAPELSSR